ncbi:MAG TPA: (2Fe-2S)-binding protein, partial [Micromonosporaceae bacterium]
MYACICERVRESDVRLAIRCGAHTEESVGAACGAGTGCGSCL